MRKYILFLMLAVGLVCSAATKIVLYDAIDWLDISSLATNGASTVSGRTNCNGQIVSISIELEGNAVMSASVNIATVAGTGSSIGGQKVLYSGTIADDTYTNLWDTAEFLWNDTVNVVITNLSTNAVAPKVLLINKE